MGDVMKVTNSDATTNGLTSPSRCGGYKSIQLLARRTQFPNTPRGNLPDGRGDIRMKPRQVLVVDDDRDLARSLAGFVEMHGFEVAVASNGDPQLAGMAPEFLAQVVTAGAIAPRVVTPERAAPTLAIALAPHQIAKRDRARRRRRERRRHWRKRPLFALSASNSRDNNWDKSRKSLNYLRWGTFSKKTGD
jgi:CheY-like chemotaxis protein